MCLCFFVKLMAIFAFLKEKKNEKRKKYWSFLQIRTMCMPLGHLENEFGCYQLKVSCRIKEGFIDYFYIIVFCTELRNFFPPFDILYNKPNWNLILWDKITAVKSRAYLFLFCSLWFLPSPLFLLSFHWLNVNDCHMINIIYFFFKKSYLQFHTTFYNSLVWLCHTSLHSLFY